MGRASWKSLAVLAALLPAVAVQVLGCAGGRLGAPCENDLECREGLTCDPGSGTCAEPRSPACCHDEFRQAEVTAATILWVIDNSGSMCEEQFNLRSNVGLFLDALTREAPGARFHMGVVTTDTNDPSQRGRLQNTYAPTLMTALCTDPPPALDCTTGLPVPMPKWVDETMIAAGTIGPVFDCLASVGIGGSGGETALGAARMALSPTLLNDPMANAGFYIPGSLMVIIFVGDEDDCSVCSGTTCSVLPSLSGGLDCPLDRLAELTPVQDFVAYMGALVLPGNDATLTTTGLLSAAIIGLDPYGNSYGPNVPDPGGQDALVPICSIEGQGSAAPAPRIEAFTRSFDDYLEYSICDADFGAELGGIGARIAALLTGGCLQSPPCPGATAADVTVRVTSPAGAARVLVAGTDYDLVCASPAGACQNSAGAACPGGWRLEFANPPPAGSRVEVLYARDGSGACP